MVTAICQDSCLWLVAMVLCIVLVPGLLEAHGDWDGVKLHVLGRLGVLEWDF